MSADFRERISSAYSFKGDSILVGLAMVEGEPVSGALVRLPLRTLNRHGLIAGATGTGKTKTLQGVAGALSDAGVPTLVMDIKGDLSGIGAEGVENSVVQRRSELMEIPFRPTAYPVELLTLSEEKGVRLRATVTEFGPILLGKILSLSDAQQSLLAVVMKFCDDEGLLLLDLNDLKKALHFVVNDGKVAFEAEYGRITTASAGTILRKIVALEQEGADRFFGERSFEVDDLLRIDESGRGYVSVVRLTDMQSRPALFSTFMLQLLAEVYDIFPEEGDLEQPKLVIFIDEAHLIFREASKSLVDQIETVIRLIRSKGVGIVFCTQGPDDVPAAILSQLGFKIQHALRAFTAKDRKSVRSASENFPITSDYQVDRLITELGIGEAFVTGLDERGRPTPLVHTLVAPPLSRMDLLSDKEIDAIVAGSLIVAKYDEVIERDSAYKILSEKAEAAAERQAEAEAEAAVAAEAAVSAKKAAATKKRSGRGQANESALHSLAQSQLAREIGRTVAREATRGLLGVLGLSTSGRAATKKRTRRR